MTILTDILAATRAAGDRRPPFAKVEERASNPTALLDEVEALARAGKGALALGRVSEGLEKQPDDGWLWSARGVLLAHVRRYREAVRAFHHARSLGMASDDFDRRFAWVLLGAGAAHEAGPIFERLVASNPDSMDLRSAAAFVAQATGDLAREAHHLRAALDLRSDDADVRARLSRCETGRGDAKAGLAIASEVLSVAPAHIDAWQAAAFAHERLGQRASIIEALDHVIALATHAQVPASDPVVRLARVNRAFEQYETGNAAVAIADTADILREGPHPIAQFHLALHLISTGHFESGWERFTARWLVDPFRGQRSHVELPRWTGQELRGRRLLIGAEQGIGDVIMFARFVREASAKGAFVALAVKPAHRRLASSIPGADLVLSSGDPLPAFDYFVPMGSLMAALGTEIDVVPRDVPYLSIEPAARERWSKRLPGVDRLRVGLVWAGDPKHVRDDDRSIAFTAFEPLLDVEGVEFYSLQKGLQSSQLAASASGHHVVDLAPELDDYMDALAAVDALDLVITVDTSIAHAAGALGKPVWTLVQEPAEHRWLADREDTVWYPTMRLFRQTEYRHWASVVDRVRLALTAAVDAHRRGQPVHGPAAAPWKRPATTFDLTGVPLVIEARHVVMQVPDDDRAEYRSLKSYGEYLYRFTSIVAQIAPTSGAVIEVGAGIGTIALPLACRLGADGHLLAAEFRSLRAEFLAQNAYANRIGNMTIVRAPLSGLEEGDSIDGLHVDNLDGIVLHDDDGAAAVLAHAERTVWKFRPWIAVEGASAESLRLLAERLASYGCRCWSFTLPMFDPLNYNRCEIDVFGGAVRHGLLAIPEEREAWLPPGDFTEVASG